AFLRAVIEAPDDDAPRLMFADWLEERGDVRGEFIRVQCELARLPEDDSRRDVLEEREGTLLETHGSLWLGALPAPPGVNWGAFRRGFVESLWMNCEEPEAAALAAAFAAVPVRCLVMTGLSGPKLEEILSGAHLARLHTLVVRCCGSGNTAAELLA